MQCASEVRFSTAPLKKGFWKSSFIVHLLFINSTESFESCLQRLRGYQSFSDNWGHLELLSLPLN